MFNFEEKVIVGFEDIAYFVGNKHDISWNAFHEMVFGDPYSYFRDSGLINYEELDEFIMSEKVIDLMREFMDHIEVEEFYWVAI